MNEGWIKLHRRFLEWEWFELPEMIKLFIYFLLKANHKSNKWKGIKVERGQLITGRKKLSKELRMSEQKVRTCIERLKSTSEITIKTTNKYSIVTVCNYDNYNKVDSNKQPTKQPDSNQQVTSKQPANNQQLTTNKNNKNEKNDKNNNIEFDIFWNLYDKKVGKKEKIKSKWNNLTKEIQQKIIDYIPKYIESQPDKQYRKHPETFLNNESWNDEIIRKKGSEKLGNSADENFKFN